MGIIQSAVNQALGTVGTVAGIGRVAKTGQESVDLQKKAAADAIAEREKKKASIQLIEDELKKTGYLKDSAIDIPMSKKDLYMKEKLMGLYEDVGDYEKSFNLMDQVIKVQNRLKAMEEKRAAKAFQNNQSQEFQKNFIEGVNSIKGVRSVTTYGADTGEPYLRSRTVYTPGREEVK